MIRIERDRFDEEGVEIRPSAEWFTLASQWTQRAIVDKQPHKAQGQVFHHDQVHAALEKLCYGKCAYCECNVEASGPWDVEHYRPKGRVFEDQRHPGYYWLTYTWANLLLSCVFCNQRRREKPTWQDPALRESAGKADHFPLRDPATRATAPDDDLKQEARLLLDPTEDDPEAHLTFDLNGKALPREGSAMGAESIDVYFLWRTRLTQLRRRYIEVALKQVAMARAAGLTPLHALKVVLDPLCDPALPLAGTARAMRRDPAAFGLLE